MVNVCYQTERKLNICPTYMHTFTRKKSYVIPSYDVMLYAMSPAVFEKKGDPEWKFDFTFPLDSNLGTMLRESNLT